MRKVALLLNCSILILSGCGGGGGSGSNVPAPSVSISASSVNTTVVGDVSFQATVHNVLVVNKVEFYIDGILKSTDTLSPYDLNLDTRTINNTPHSIIAKAYNSANNILTSNVINFTVNNPTPTLTTQVASSNSAVSKLNIGGLSTNICGIDITINYIAGITTDSNSISQSGGVLNSTNSLIVSDIQNNSAHIQLVSPPQLGGFSSGEILTINFTTSSTIQASDIAIVDFSAQNCQ